MASQYVLPDTDPKGCSGWRQHPFKKTMCQICWGKALDHASIPEEHALEAIAASQEHKPTEIVPGVYVSGYRAAMDFKSLQEIGVTHVINCARGIRQFFPTFSQPEELFTFLNLEMDDAIHQDLSKGIEKSLPFMEECLEAGGKVLVHCMQGASRSASIVLAYIHKTDPTMSLEEAIQMSKAKRPCINPNSAFKKQLAQYWKA